MVVLNCYLRECARLEEEFHADLHGVKRSEVDQHEPVPIVVHEWWQQQDEAPGRVPRIPYITIAYGGRSSWIFRMARLVRVVILSVPHQLSCGQALLFLAHAVQSARGADE